MVTTERVRPDFGAITGTGLHDTVGALITVVLLLAVATAVVSAAVWAVATVCGSWQAAARARTGVALALTAAALAGAVLTIAGWLLHLGVRLSA